MEVRIDDEWGTVCDTGFDEKAGNIVCRILGFGSVKSVLGRAGYGRGIGTIHLTNLRCVYMCTGKSQRVCEYCVCDTAFSSAAVFAQYLHLHTVTAVILIRLCQACLLTAFVTVWGNSLISEHYRKPPSLHCLTYL